MGKRGRTSLAVALAAIAVFAMPRAATADYGDPTQQGPTRAITFPVVGDVTYTDTFGAPRSGGRLHEGQDLMGAKMTPLVAAADGVITWITIPEASYGYMLTITGDDGWSYNYVHLNDDTPGTDDGAAPLEYVFGPGIARGVRVVAGQLVGYIGDSGNAEETPPHVHFEMEDPSGVPVNPYASLQAATRLAGPVGGMDPASAPALPRVAGADRVATAVEASKLGWPSGADEVVLAAGDRYDESLPASVLASSANAPLLLSLGSSLPASVTAELDRLGASSVTVIGSVPASVDRELTGLGLTVRRIAGANAVATAAAIAQAIGAADKTVVLVNSSRFADGISAAALAAGRGWPILLSSDTWIPQVTVDTWRALGANRVILVGGPAVLGDNILRFVPGGVRVAGSDRYATSVAAAEQSLELGGRSLARTLLATGTNYPDALTAGSLAAQLGAAVLLVDGTAGTADGATRSFLRTHAGDVTEPRILGGTAAVGVASLLSIGSVLGL